MSKRGNKEFLADIKEAIRRIKIYVKEIDYLVFLKDLKIQDAVIRNFEIIGEAVKNLTDELRDSYSQIPWKKIAGIKDKLIHHYFGVNLEILWTIINEELTDLEKKLNTILI